MDELKQTKSNVKKTIKGRGIGRPSEKPERLRDYRGNLLLNDKEEAVFKRVLVKMTEAENRRVSGAELLRRLVMPFLRDQAVHLGMELDVPKSMDLLPIENTNEQASTSNLDAKINSC